MQEVSFGNCVGCLPAETTFGYLEMAEQHAQGNLDQPPDEAERAGYANMYAELTSNGTRLLRSDGSGRPYSGADEFVAVVCADIRSHALNELARVERCEIELIALLARCRGGTTTRGWLNGQPITCSNCPIQSDLAAIQAELE